MPVQELKGIRLKDLYKEKNRGWADLSLDERKAYLDENPTLKDKSFKYVSNVYDNRKYVEEFGLNDFKANTNKAERDEKLRKKYQEDAINDLFGEGFDDESAYDNLSTKQKLSNLSSEAFRELLNSEYKFPAEIKEKTQEVQNLPAWKMMSSASDKWEGSVSEGLGYSNQGILDEISDKYAKKDLADSQQRSDEILSNINQMSELEFNNLFHDVVEGEKDSDNKGIGLYNAFKSRHEMKDFGPEAKKQLLANYFAVLESTGNPVRAEEAITNYLQDYIHDHQTAGDWWGSALSGIGTKAAGDFGNLIVGMHALTGRMAYGEKWLNNFLQGLDENGNERGWLDNVKYWNGVDQYNTFDHDAIWSIEENGGISPFNWLASAGRDRNLSSALNEGTKMMGYMAAQAAIGKGLGAGFKGAAKVAGGIFSTAGELLEGSSKASRAIMQYAAPLTVSAVNAVPIATAYAKGSYDKTYQEASQRLELMKENELNSMFDGVQITEHGFDGTKEKPGSTDIAATLNAYVADMFEQRVAAGENPEDIDVQEIASNAIQLYRNERKASLDEQYKDLEDEARMEATSAYERNATIEFVRMSGVNYVFKDYLMDKSTRLAKRANRTPLKAVDNAGKLEMKTTFLGETVNPKYARYYDAAKAVWGGFESNYMDDITAAYAQGFSLGRYNNKLEQAFNPERSVATSNWLAGITSALASAEGALVDPQSWYDGLIGGLGTVQSVSVGRGALGAFTKTGRTANRYNLSELEAYANRLGLTKEQFIRGEGYEDLVRKASKEELSDEQVAEAAKELKDNYGFDKLVEDGTLKEISFGERLNNYVMNPLLQNYSDAREAERQFQNRIDAGNKAIAEKKTAINDIINVVNSLNTYEQALVDGGIIDLEEAKAHKAFELATLIDSWSKDEVLSQSQFVQDAKAKLKRLANGQVTEADINEFLSYNQNKSVADQADAAEIAKERLQKNAMQLINMQQKYSDAIEKVKSMPDYAVVANLTQGGADFVAKQVAFDTAMYDNRIERVNQMSEEAGVTTNMDMPEGNAAALGTKASRQNYYMEAVEAVQKASEDARKAEEEYNKARKLRSRDPLRKLKIESKRLAMEEAHRRETAAKKLAQLRESLVDAGEVVLSADEILNLNATDRARMLHRENRENYSAEQRAEIDKAIQRIRLKDPDGLQKIQDIATLTEANQDLLEANEIFLNNMEAAANYADYMANQRAEQFENVVRRNEWTRSDIEIENASTDTDKLNLLKKRELDYIEHYFNTHEGSRETLAPALEISKLVTDVNSSVSKVRQQVIDGIYERTDLTSTDKTEAIRRTNDAFEKIGKAAVNSMLLNDNATDAASAMRALEETLDAQNDEATKHYYNRIMDEVEKLGHQRDATTIQSREQKRQAEEFKRQEASKKDGKNFGFDGYKVGDKIYHKDGRAGVVSGFFKSGESGIMKVSWNGEAKNVKSQYSPSELPNLSKIKPEAKPETKPEDNKPQEPKTIETPRPQSEKSDAELISEGETVPEFTEEGKIIQKSEDQQAEAAMAQAEGSSYTVQETSAQEKANRKGNVPTPGLLEGNGLYRYDNDSLISFGRMKLRKGRNQGDTMNAFFDWLAEKGIQLQEIIDTELNKIYTANPDTKVQFMLINRSGVNAHVLNVVEFTPEIEAIHNKDLGGVVESEGKRYLVIGTTYSNNGLGPFFNIANPLRASAKAAFDSGAEQYVHPTMYTKIASIDAGRLVKQQVNEESGKIRTLGEIFADKERNPNGITFNNAIMGIMYSDKYFVTNRDAGARKVFPPGRSDATLGRVFLMIPAANGNYIPVALKSNITVDSLNEGEYKDAIYDVLRRVASPDINIRKKAVAELNSYVVLNNNTNVLVGNDKHNNISIVRNGTVVYTRKIDGLFNIEEFSREFFSTPFVINITQRDIENPIRLKWLDEAGALKTDVSMLRTTNAPYQIFEIDSTGKPIEIQVNQPVPNPRKEGVSKSSISTVIAGKTYRLIDREYYDESNSVVTDPSIRASIRYNLLIQKSKILPVLSSQKSGANIYIMNNSQESPEVIRRNSDGTIKVASRDEALDVINKVREKIEAEKRAKAAQEALNYSLESGNFEAVEYWDDAGIPIEQPQTPIQPQPQKPAESPTVKEPSVKDSESKYDPNKATRKSLAQLEADKKVTNFGSLYSQRRKELNDIAKEKGWNWGKNAKEKEAFLNKMGINTATISDMNTFIDMLKNCK